MSIEEAKMSIEEIEAEIASCVDWDRMEVLIDMAVEWLFDVDLSDIFEDRN